jgi:hypothetical protein
VIRALLAAAAVAAQPPADAAARDAIRRGQALVDSARAAPDPTADALLGRAVALADSAELAEPRLATFWWVLRLTAAVPRAERRLALADRTGACDDARRAAEAARDAELRVAACERCPPAIVALAVRSVAARARADALEGASCP